jgi:hypothetical protein
MPWGCISGPADGLRTALTTWDEDGHAASLITITAPHDLADRLSQLFDTERQQVAPPSPNHPRPRREPERMDYELGAEDVNDELVTVFPDRLRVPEVAIAQSVAHASRRASRKEPRSGDAL